MSNDVAVRLTGLGKMYKIFSSRLDNLLDALGLGRFIASHGRGYREFWALRGIDLELRQGERMGVIGRNGAGKSTLLKLITGNLAATEGTLKVNGRVQALLEVGGGLHPEFTGYENIHAALTYQGLSREEIKEAEADIADFTELGEFLAQPFKTYSQGMQARLSFAIATAIKPEILIIDEILGVGDAYFFSRSTERMRALVEGGASVLIVSHALDQILRFCEETVWLERGQVVMRGRSMEVVRAYETFTRVLEDRRLKAKSRKLRSKAYSSVQQDSYVDQLIVRLTFEGQPGDACDVAEVMLWRNDELEDRVLVGHAQDADTLQSAFVKLDEGHWSPPRHAGGEFYRSLCVDDGRLAGATQPVRWGSVLFYLWVFSSDGGYGVDVRYRCGSGLLMVEILRNGVLHTSIKLATGNLEWATHRVRLDQDAGAEHVAQPEVSQAPREAGTQESTRGLPPSPGPDSKTVRHWPGEGSLTIEHVSLLGPDGQERAVFPIGTPMVVSLTLRAHKSDAFSIIPVAVLYRVDGIRVTTHIGERRVVHLTAGETRQAELRLGPLNLGDGHYVFAVALYRKLSHLEPSEFYDLIDRSYEFEMVGNPPFAGLFQHSGDWSWE